MDISKVTSTFDLWLGLYLYNLMTESYFGNEIAIGFKNVMLRIISNIVFSCKVTIQTNTFLKWGDLDTFFGSCYAHVSPHRPKSPHYTAPMSYRVYILM